MRALLSAHDAALITHVRERLSIQRGVKSARDPNRFRNATVCSIAVAHETLTLTKEIPDE